MVIKLCQESGNDWYRIYLIRQLSVQQGVEFVQTLLQQPRFSWIFPAKINQQVHHHSSANLLQEMYVNMSQLL